MPARQVNIPIKLNNSPHKLKTMKKSKWISVIIDAQIEELFEVINKLENLSSGDITPAQDDRLEGIKESLGKLVNEYVNQNK